MATATLDLNVNPSQGLQGLNQFDNGLNRTAHRVSSFRETLEDTFNFGGLAAAGFGAASGYALKSFSNNILQMAGDAQEAQGKFSAVMGVMTSDARKLGNELARSYNFSTAVANEAISSMVDQMHKGGASMKQALSWTDELSKRAADIQAFNNIDDVGRVMDAFKASMTGENERLKALGIVINQATIKYQMMKEAQQGVVYATEREAKMGATYNLILQQSAAAAGQVARESDNLGNRGRALQARWDDLKTSMGNAFIPVATKVTDRMGKIAEAFDKWSPKAKETAVWTAAITAGLVGVGIPLGKAFIGFKNYFNISKLAQAATLGNAAATEAERTALDSETGSFAANSAASTQNGTAITALTAQKTAETAARMANVQALEAELVALRGQNAAMNGNSIGNVGASALNSGRVGNALTGALSLEKPQRISLERPQRINLERNVSLATAAPKKGLLGAVEKSLSKINGVFSNTLGLPLKGITGAFSKLGGTFTKIIPVVTRLMPHLLKFGGWVGLTIGAIVGGVKLAKNAPELVDKFFTAIGPKLIEAIKHPLKTAGKGLEAVAKTTWGVVTKTFDWGCKQLGQAANGIAEGFDRAVRWITDRKGELDRIDGEKRAEKQKEAKDRENEAREHELSSRKINENALGASKIMQQGTVGNAYSKFSGTEEVINIKKELAETTNLLYGEKGYYNQQVNIAKQANESNTVFRELNHEAGLGYQYQGGFDVYYQSKHSQGKETALDRFHQISQNRLAEEIKTNEEQNNKDFESLMTELRKTSDADKITNVKNIDDLMKTVDSTDLDLENNTELFSKAKKISDASKKIQKDKIAKEQSQNWYDTGQFEKLYAGYSKGATVKQIDKDDESKGFELSVFDENDENNGAQDFLGGMTQGRYFDMKMSEVTDKIGATVETHNGNLSEQLKREEQIRSENIERLQQTRSDEEEAIERAYSQQEANLNLLGFTAKTFEDQMRVNMQKNELRSKQIEDLQTENGEKVDLTEKENYWRKQKELARSHNVNNQFTYQAANGKNVTTTLGDLSYTLSDSNRDIWQGDNKEKQQDALINTIKAMGKVGINTAGWTKENIQALPVEELRIVKNALNEEINKATAKAANDEAEAAANESYYKSKNNQVRQLQNEQTQEEFNLNESRAGFQEDERKRQLERTERNRSVAIRNRERETALGSRGFDLQQKQFDKYYARMSAQTGRNTVLAQLNDKAALSANQFAYEQSRFQGDIGSLTNEQNENNKNITSMIRTVGVNESALSQDEQAKYSGSLEQWKSNRDKIANLERYERDGKLTAESKKELGDLRSQQSDLDKYLASIESKAGISFAKMNDRQMAQYQDLYSKQMSLDDELYEKKTAMQDAELDYNDKLASLEDERYNERMRLAEERVKPYIDMYRTNAEENKEDATKGVSHVARVEKGSSEAFAILNRIYDAGQKSQAQRVDNIEKYVKRMTAYLTTMAANSTSDFELELNA